MADEKEKAKKQREPSRLAWRWWVFWKGRSGWRTAWALVLAIPPLLALIYLALSQSDQAQVVAAIQTVGQALGATGLRVGVEVALVVCALASFALLVAPGYRQRRYVPLSSAFIPPATVYVDAENIDRREIIEPLVQRARGEVLAPKRTNWRADLLFFMDATHVGSRESENHGVSSFGRKPKLNWKYEALTKNGFRLFDSPHNPTGKADMKEAVDREIAMHALERALVGPLGQKFVIASGDGDYAPLVYRLIELGHVVEMWVWGQTTAYDVVATHLPLTIHHLDAGLELTAQPGAMSDHVATQSAAFNTPQPLPARPAAHAGKPVTVQFAPRTPPEIVFPQVGMVALYAAIYNTVELCEQLERVVQAPSARNGKLNAMLGDSMKQSLAAVGYSGKGSSASWLRTMTAVHALQRTQGGFPLRGTTTAAGAARRHYFMALAIARAAARAVSTRPDQAITMRDIVDQLTEIVSATDDAGPALVITAPERDDRYLDARYLVHCARALGLLQFDDVADTQALITRPRLTALAEQIIPEQAGGQPDAPEEPDASI